MKLSNKNKIILASVGFLIITGILFSYIFTLFDKYNQGLSDRTVTARKELAELQAEQKNFELGKKDITLLQGKQFQPENFFSSDTSFVKEVKTLEEVSRRLQVTLSVQVNGTVGSAPKAKTNTDIRIISATLQVHGSFSSVLQFIDTLEHLSFITNIKSVSVSPDLKSGEVNATLTGNFYVKK